MRLRQHGSRGPGLPERTRIGNLVDRICDVAERAILENGGRKTVPKNEEIVYLIATGRPRKQLPAGN